MTPSDSIGSKIFSRAKDQKMTFIPEEIESKRDGTIRLDDVKNLPREEDPATSTHIHHYGAFFFSQEMKRKQLFHFFRTSAMLNLITYKSWTFFPTRHRDTSLRPRSTRPFPPLSKKRI
jgi:hypothetical protein